MSGARAWLRRPGPLWFENEALDGSNVMSILDLPGQGLLQIGELGLAFVLSALIGIEREIRHKSAGLRTYTLVGLAAALIMLVSKYGFMNILVNDRVVLDPSRIAAQIVTGIGFIGGGLIFVRRDSVRGLTTAAIVWLTAAIGMACGAGLPVLALVVTAGHFIVVFAFPIVARHLPRSRWTPSLIQISYKDGREILRDVLIACTNHDFAVSHLQVQRTTAASAEVAGAELTDAVGPMASAASTLAIQPASDAHAAAASQERIATVVLEVQGTGPISKLAAKLANIEGVVSVSAGDVNVLSD
jgi:putative Mg2+ transporter-C (MgtC) family protein